VKKTPGPRISNREAGLIKRLKAYREALTRISNMGRVCPEFEICSHPACSDSCGAVLVALEALKAPHDGI
jgi:hypothetical protein